MSSTAEPVANDRVSVSARARDRASVPPAVLAALAEAGVFFLPLREFLLESAHASGGPLASFPAFLLLFTGAVAVGTVARRQKAFVPVTLAAALGLMAWQVAAWGSADPGGWLFLLFVVSLVAGRILSLSFRDWQEPIGDSFAVGAAVLLLEMGFTSVAAPFWRSLLPVVVVLFFLASLASRAASVRLVSRPARRQAQRSERSRTDPHWVRPLGYGVATLIVVGLILALAAGLGARGGVFQWVGRLAYLALTSALTAFAFVVVRVLLPPLNWVFSRLHLSLRPLQAIQQALQNRHPTQPGVTGHASLWARVAGFLFTSAMLAFLLMFTWRRWSRLLPPNATAPAPPEPPLVTSSGWNRLRRMSSRMARWQPPADTVRRWYAEALLILSRRGLEKPPSLTPGEFLPRVTAAFPECASGFAALTRAYEDVRYGSRAFERSALDRLDVQREFFMEVFRRKERSDDRDQA